MKGCDNGFLAPVWMRRSKANETVKERKKKRRQRDPQQQQDGTRKKNRLQIAKDPNPPTEH
jgi:hypothetical protein